jgi:hypothetical protein
MEQDSATVRRYNLAETGICTYEKALMVRAKDSGYVNDTTFVANTGATFLYPITKQVIESCSAVFLQQIYAEFHKLGKPQISKQFATITDELNEMFDEYKDVIPVDDDGINYLVKDYIWLLTMMRMKSMYLSQNTS